jgi:hypothetical protein
MEINPEENKFNIEILTKQNILRVNFKFKYDIDILYNLFIQPHHYKEIYKGFIIDYKCIKGNPYLNSIGSEFMCLWRDNNKSKLRIENVIETPTFKLLNFYIYSIESTNFRINSIYKFYKNSTESFTYHCYEFRFETPQALSFHQVQFNTSDYIKMYNTFNKYVQRQTNITEQVESVVIDTGIDSLWEVLKDWNKFRELAPTIADKVEYDEPNGGSADNSGLIKLVFEKDSCNIVHVLKIQRSFKDEVRGELIVSLLNSNMKSLSQDLVFCLYSLGEGQCVLIFKHVFKKIVDNGFLENLSKSKQIILTSLRDNFINKKNPNYAGDDNSTLDDVIDFI